MTDSPPNPLIVRPNSAPQHGLLSSEELSTYFKMQAIMMKSEEKRHERRMDIAYFAGAIFIIIFCLSSAFILGMNGYSASSAAFVAAPVVISAVKFFISKSR